MKIIILFTVLRHLLRRWVIHTKRKCKKCGRVIGSDAPGMICWTCYNKKNETVEVINDFKTLSDGFSGIDDNKAVEEINLAAKRATNKENIIENLKDDKNFSKKVVHIEEIPAKEGEYCELGGLPDQISLFLKDENIKLFKHQCELTKHIRKGKNVIITTPTASGKTLAFSLPILEKFATDSNATALFIYPANALINDQLKKLIEYEKKTNISLDAFSYNKDTENADRKYIRANARTLLTTPYMLHRILFWHFQWCNFYSNLKYVVIDEAHEYSGVFGSNVALLIRRLRRIANYYGADPQFILSSATLANPIEFSEQLVGEKFELINEDASSRGRKYFVMYNPYVEEEHPSIEYDTRDLFSMLILNDLQTLCFTKTKYRAEKTISMVESYLKKNNPEIISKIAPYRAGYTSEERKNLEKGLKNKDLIGVTSTNALELGVDLGSLDAVIISSYPGTMISTWQQAGRAGRGTDDSLVIFLASDDPLNQCIVKKPQFILDKGHENAIIDLNNEYIMKKHIQCAVSELTLTHEDAEKYFGLNNSDLENFEKEGFIRYGIMGWDYNGMYKSFNHDYPALEHNLKHIDVAEFEIVYNGRVLEYVSREEGYGLSYIGASYRNQGKKYVVKNFNLNNGRIILEKKDVETNRGSWKKINLEILEKFKTKKYGTLKLHFGELEVDKTFYTYEIVQGRSTNFKKMDVKPVTFITKGLWIEIPDSIINELKNQFSATKITEWSINGVVRALSSMFPYYVLCSRCDLEGFYDKDYHNRQSDTIFFFDTHPGGIGLAEKGLETFPDLVKITLNMVKDCKCKQGCALCIYSNPCGTNYQRLHKKGTIFLLEKILGQIELLYDNWIEEVKQADIKYDCHIEDNDYYDEGDISEIHDPIDEFDEIPKDKILCGVCNTIKPLNVYLKDKMKNVCDLCLNGDEKYLKGEFFVPTDPQKHFGQYPYEFIIDFNDYLDDYNSKLNKVINDFEERIKKIGEEYANDINDEYLDEIGYLEPNEKFSAEDVDIHDFFPDMFSENRYRCKEYLCDRCGKIFYSYSYEKFCHKCNDAIEYNRNTSEINHFVSQHHNPKKSPSNVNNNPSQIRDMDISNDYFLEKSNKTENEPFIIETKFCISCGKTKSLSEFQKLGNTEIYCESCRKLEKCPVCGEYEPRRKFFLNKIKQAECKYCREKKECTACRELKSRRMFDDLGRGEIYCTSCKENKKCPICGHFEPRRKFYVDGIEQLKCKYCRETKTCKGCQKIKSRREFPNLGRSQLFRSNNYCNYCVTTKECPVCKKTKKRKKFMKNGVEGTECLECIEKKIMTKKEVKTVKKAETITVDPKVRKSIPQNYQPSYPNHENTKNISTPKPVDNSKNYYDISSNKKQKLCKGCGNLRSRKKFIKNGKEEEYCSYCRKQMKCKGCKEYKSRYEFPSGLRQKYCKSCKELKICSKCGKTLARYKFIKRGIERDSCKYCNRNIIDRIFKI